MKARSLGNRARKIYVQLLVLAFFLSGAPLGEAQLESKDREYILRRYNLRVLPSGQAQPESEDRVETDSMTNDLLVPPTRDFQSSQPRFTFTNQFKLPDSKVPTLSEWALDTFWISVRNPGSLRDGARMKKKGFNGFLEETIVKVASLPRIPVFEARDGTHFDAGIIYRQVKIFGIPLWIYDVGWCGYINGWDQYYPSSKAELEELAAPYGIDLPEYPPIPFWDEVGGRVIILALLVCVLIRSMMRRSAVQALSSPRVSSPKVRFQHPTLEPVLEPVQAPIRVVSPPSLKLQKQEPSEMKTCCVNCGQKIAFDPSMLNALIQCPACKSDTYLLPPD